MEDKDVCMKKKTAVCRKTVNPVYEEVRMHTDL